MKISSIFFAAVTLLAGKASASTPSRLRAMTEDIAANATSASIGIDGNTEDGVIDHFANLPPFFQALANPENFTESQYIQDLMAKDELSENQFDLLDVSPSSMSMSMAMAGSTTANHAGPSGSGGGWGGKSGKGNDCRIEQMRGSYVFQYDLWQSEKCGGYGVPMSAASDFSSENEPSGSYPCVWETEYQDALERSVLLYFNRPQTDADNGKKGRGAMEGFFCVPSSDKTAQTKEYAVAIQTGVSQKDVISFRINLPDIGRDVSVLGEFNCKTEEVYFGLDYNVDDVFTFGFTTRKPAKKRSNKFNPCR